MEARKGKTKESGQGTNYETRFSPLKFDRPLQVADNIKVGLYNYFCMLQRTNEAMRTH
jgi:hypothetical protein